jgi:protein disulfide-isomerase
LCLFATTPITTHYSKAKEIAQDLGRPLLILFTGSDWSSSSEEVLQECKSIEFEKSLENQFVLVQADYPELNNQKELFLEQNKELKERYDVSFFPTLVMTDPEGREITRLGALSLSSKEFAEHLRDLYVKYSLLRREVEDTSFIRHSIQAIEGLYKSARELRCPYYIEKLMRIGMEREEGVFFPLEKYTSLVCKGESNTLEALCIKEKIIQRDPDNKEMGRLRLALLDFQAREGKEPHQATEPLGAYISHFSSSIDMENLQKLQCIISECFSERKEQHCIEEPLVVQASP